MKKAKILAVFGLLLAMGVTACNGGGNQSNNGGGEQSQQQGGDPSQGGGEHTHTFGEWTQTKAPTCTEKGSEERVCACGEKETRDVKALGHDWNEWEVKAEATCAAAGSKERTCKRCGEKEVEAIAQLAHNFVEGEEYIQEGVKYLECSVCKNAGVLEWAAKNYAASESVMEATASDGSVRFTSNPTAANAAGDGIDEKSYVVYNIQLHKAVEHAGLDFDIQPSSYGVAIFDTVENDQKPGKDMNEAGEIVASAHRYALYVNGERVQLGEDPGASDARGWYSWPVDFSLKKGENKIKLVCMGGYRAKMYNFRLTNIPKFEHEHDYSAKVKDNAAGADYPASAVYACTMNCGKTAIRWAAKDYDATSSEIEATASDGSIRMNSAQKANAAGDNVEGGGHLIYKVNVPTAVANAGLQFDIQAHNQNVAIFDAVANDSGAGKDFVNGQVVDATKRYALFVNDVRVELGEDPGKSTARAWFTWPVEFPLNAGVNKIEIVNMGGYRAKMYNFQLVNLPAIEGSTFTLGEEWKSDDNGHWKEVAGQDGVKFVYKEHVLVADSSKTDVAATCTEAGKSFKKCSICGKEVEVAIPAKGHTWVGGDVTVEGTKGTQTITCSVCNATSTVTGGICGTFLWADALQSGGASLASDGKVNAGDYTLVVFNVPAAGTYVVTLPMQGSNNNGTRTLNGTGQGFSISANGVAGTFLGNGKTYAEFFGENQTTWVDVAFGEVELVAGKNEIKVTALNGNYRTKINGAGNVTVAAKPAA